MLRVRLKNKLLTLVKIKKSICILKDVISASNHLRRQFFSILCTVHSSVGFIMRPTDDLMDLNKWEYGFLKTESTKYFFAIMKKFIWC